MYVQAYTCCIYLSMCVSYNKTGHYMYVICKYLCMCTFCTVTLSIFAASFLSSTLLFSFALLSSTGLICHLVIGWLPPYYTQLVGWVLNSCTTHHCHTIKSLTHPLTPFRGLGFSYQYSRASHALLPSLLSWQQQTTGVSWSAFSSEQC